MSKAITWTESGGWSALEASHFHEFGSECRIRLCASMKRKRDAEVADVLLSRDQVFELVEYLQQWLCLPENKEAP